MEIAAFQVFILAFMVCESSFRGRFRLCLWAYLNFGCLLSGPLTCSFACSLALLVDVVFLCGRVFVSCYVRLLQQNDFGVVV